MDDARSQFSDQIPDDQFLHFADGPIFSRGMLLFSDPKLVKHDLVLVLLRNFPQAATQAKTQAPSIKSIENDLPAYPTRGKLIAKAHRPSQSRRPRIARREAKTVDGLA